MFGRNDNQTQDNQDGNAIPDASINAAFQAGPVQADGSVVSPGPQPVGPAPAPQAFSAPAPDPAQAAPMPAAPMNPAAPAGDDWQHPGLPPENPQEVISDFFAAPAGAPAPEPIYRPPAGADTGNELIDIKQQALTQLSPLVDHLEQSPEEEFHTTMMMIRASDDQSLIKKAWDAAQQIADEKVKAQALLDIVNEINYFTQKND